MRHLQICSLLLTIFCLLALAERRKVRKRLRTLPAIKPVENIIEDIPEKMEVTRQASSEDSAYRFLNPFSLFSLVQFPNSECTSSSSTQGTCYTNSECTTRGGTADGSCASGFGTCCTFANDCNTETSQNGTYFNSPTTISLVCSLMINPMNDNICQVRLNFEKLQLRDPDETGACKSDYLQVTGGVSGSNIPTLCGNLAGQHVVYSAIPNFPARLSVVVDTQMAGVDREWKIKVLQYECDSPALAPEGCLQYFTGISGNVSSFNWGTMDNVNLDTASSHLANLDYNICVRRESGYCAIEWGVSPPADTQLGYFSLSGDLPAAAPIPVADAKNGDTDCTADYVTIPGGIGGTDPTSLPKDRFCGQALAYCPDTACTALVIGPVKSSVTPFTLGVFTDATEDPAADTQNRGFNLMYRQQPCS